MPAMLTHEFFGRDAIAHASQLLEFATADERNAFLLGNQGPDPLFYLVAAPWVDKESRLGGLMHRERPAHLMLSLRDAIDMLPGVDKPVGRAYAAGFICHYLLDTAAHPLIFAQQYALCDAGIEGLGREHGSRVHQEMERDLDEMVLYTKTGETVATFRPYREVLRYSSSALSAIDKLFFYMNLWTYSKTIALDTFSVATKSFRRMQRLFWAPGLVKGRVLTGVEHLATGAPYSQYAAMAHRVRRELTSAFDNHEHLAWENPFTGECSTESFWDLYEEAQERVFDALVAFFQPGFDLDAALELTGGRNFSGAPVAEDAPVGSVGE